MSKNKMQMGGGMLGQIQKLQQEMIKAQEALADETLEVSAGGGAITINNVAGSVTIGRLNSEQHFTTMSSCREQT